MKHGYLHIIYREQGGGLRVLGGCIGAHRGKSTSPQGRERGAKPFHALIIGLGKAYGYDIHPRHRQQA